MKHENNIKYTFYILFIKNYKKARFIVIRFTSARAVIKMRH